MSDRAPIQRSRLDDDARTLHTTRPRPNKRIAAYSRYGALAYLDGRSREAQFLKRYREDLIKHCGGSPSAIELRLIERAAWLALKLSILDEKMALGSATLHDHNYYLSWSNSLTRTLARLPRTATASPQPTLADILRGNGEAAD